MLILITLRANCLKKHLFKSFLNIFSQPKLFYYIRLLLIVSLMHIIFYIGKTCTTFLNTCQSNVSGV
ncbi:unnamed protein product [Paramecium octaurelia]|uniref:Uncharacterized protein n=1 Tax=Paramecium octaurelia TaxID=43137 RepID=A0A8S1WFG0_PAROT|nr:unnamed protein product [Paramecium octaurelia]